MNLSFRLKFAPSPQLLLFLNISKLVETKSYIFDPGLKLSAHPHTHTKRKITNFRSRFVHDVQLPQEQFDGFSFRSDPIGFVDPDPADMVSTTHLFVFFGRKLQRIVKEMVP